MADEILIAGGGLAGCTLAWALRWHGCGVRLVDRGEPVTSTKVAAGIINPITGPNLSLSWRFAELWPAALEFYRRVERESGTVLFHQTPLLRLLDSERQVEKWMRRRDASGYAELVDPSPDVPGCFASEFGGFEATSAGYLDTTAFIAATKLALGDAWQVGEVCPSDLDGGMVVFCEGMSAAANTLFDWVPFKPAKGEILTLHSAESPAERIINRGGVWLLPIGGDRFRAGATYDWGKTDSEPTAAGREEIERRLRRLLRVPYEIIDHQAAVRPVVRASKLLMGLHPAHEGVGFFNGLGSKGVLTAPFFAQQFAAHLCGDGAIDSEVDLRKNL